MTASPHRWTVPSGSDGRRCRARCTGSARSAEELRRNTESVPLSPSPRTRPAAIPSPSAASRSSYTPASIHLASVGHGQVDADVGVGVAQHAGELGGELVERASAGDGSSPVAATDSQNPVSMSE